MIALKLALAVSAHVWAYGRWVDGKYTGDQKAPRAEPAAAETPVRPRRSPPPRREQELPRQAGTGFYLGAEAGAVQVSGEDLVIGSIKPNGGFTQDGDLLVLDYGIRPAYRYFAGYATEDGAFEASYWTYQHGAHVELNGGANFIAVGFGLPSAPDNQFHFVTAESSLRTNQVDLLWRRKFLQTESLGFSWSAGLRGWNLRETVDAAGYTPGNNSDLNHVDSFSYGGGFTVGARAAARLLDRLRFVLDADFGYLVGRAFVHNDDLGRVAGNQTAAHAAAYPRRTFDQLGLAAKLEADVAPGLKVSLGATYKRFGDARTEINATCLGGDACNVDATFVHSLSFAGASAGLSYQF